MNGKRKTHLICNAHLDPVWLWQRTEGIAEAMSTFRIAADFCEKYDGFVFNHNESVLYEWVQENDPDLFERIKKLAKEGKWRVMSGWYLQPDVVMPSGESIIRQIRVGNEFFKKHFGYVPKTAIGFDAFGHSRGLVQILKKCGYENYAYMRPRETECGPFVWKGFDGSEINTYKIYEWYNTPKGEALERIKQYDGEYPQRELNCLTWGIGNHGGGPSEKDLTDINEYIKASENTEIVHSDFDAYFDELDKSDLRTVDTSLTHCMVGCYTSMVRVKQAHRRLENTLAMCEKMLWQSGVDYDENEIAKAEKALLFSEFHDVLPGSAIKKVEEDSLRLIGYGEEILDRYITKSFFKLCGGQPKANDGEIPVMIYNPHPYPVEGDFEVEFQMAEQNHPSNGIFDVRVRDKNGEYVPSQLEQEDSAHCMDWRKKVVFHTVAEPMTITRLDCELERNTDFVKIRPYTEKQDEIILKNSHLEININKFTGEITKYVLDGKNVINSIKFKVYKDNADPWGMQVDGFSECIGEFKVNEPVNVIENGDVRTKLQMVYEYGKSKLTAVYTFSKESKFLDIDVKILSADDNVMYKMCIETALDKQAAAYCQTMFGTERVHKEGKEAVFQKWCGLNVGKSTVNVINNGTYGGSFSDNEIQISLLRTPIYSAHPEEGKELVLNDREYNHIDIGERNFSFRICADETYTDCEAEMFNQKPYVLAMFPSGYGYRTSKNVTADNKHIIISALRNEKDFALLRMYNSADTNQKCGVNADGIKTEAEFKPFEVKTYIIKNENIFETNMLGE